jgi:hypothetical protein
MDLNTITGNIYNKIGYLKAGGGANATFFNLFRVNNYPVSGAYAPIVSGGTGYICNHYTIGALPISFNEYSGNHYIAKVEMSTTSACNLIVYDRLWHVGGLNLMTTVATNITGNQLPPRDIYGTSSGHGLEIWGDFNLAAVTSTSRWTVSYNDVNGIPCTAFYDKTTTTSVNQMVPFVTSSGTGVSGITSFNCNATGGGGDRIFSLVVLRRVVDIPLLIPSTNRVFDPVSIGLPQVYSGSCLAAMTYGGTTPLVMGNIYFTRG